MKSGFRTWHEIEGLDILDDPRMSITHVFVQDLGKTYKLQDGEWKEVNDACKKCGRDTTDDYCETCVEYDFFRHHLTTV